MTEEEAKTKWCPHSRVVLYDKEREAAKRALSSGHNRAAFTSSHDVSTDCLNPEFCRCIASECMAWRWEFIGSTAGYSNTEGCCGLAGRP